MLSQMILDAWLDPGNGMTDAFSMTLSYYDMQCTPASVEPFVGISSCVGMKHVVGFLLFPNDSRTDVNHLDGQMRTVDEESMH